MEPAVLALSLICIIEAVVMLVVLAVLRRVNHAEKTITSVRDVVHSHGMKMQQLHRESVSDITTFAQMNDHIWRIDHFVAGDLTDRIEELEAQVQQLLGEDEHDTEKPTKVQARPGSSIHGRGRRGVDAAARRRRV